MSLPENNASDHLRTYSVSEIEQIAKTMHQILGEDLAIPIEIDELVEKSDIDLDIYPGLEANHKILGMIGPNLETGKIQIFIDDKLADEERLIRRYRMTLSEEFSHVILHRKVIENVRTPKDFIAIQNSGNWQICDRNAKRLAASLLMPGRQILDDGRIWYTRLIRKTGFGNPESIKSVIASKMADQYLVSRHSMKIRLGEWPINLDKKIDQAMREKFDFLE